MAKTKNKWKNQEGNLCFREDYKPTGTFKIFVISMIALAFCFFAEYFIWKTYYVLIGLFPILAIIYVIALHEERENDRSMLKIVNKQVDALVKKECKKIGSVHEVKRKVFTKIRGTYGVVDARFILVLLSDRSVLEFETVSHNDAEQQYVELKSEATICSDPEKIAYMLPKEKRKATSERHISEDAKLLLILFGLFCLGVVSLGVVVLLVVRFKWLFALYVFCYLLLCIIAEGACKRINTKWSSIVNTIINAPIIVFGVFFKMAHPLVVFLFSVVVVPSVISVTVYFICGLLSMVGQPLEHSTRIFLTLTITAFLCAYCRKATKWLILHSPLKNWGNHGYETFSEDLALYLTDTKRFKLYISILYLVFLLCSSICKLEFGHDLLGEDINLAIMQSFLVFLAFGAMLQESKDAGISANALLDKISGLLE